MEHVDYPKWSQYIQKVLRHCKHRPKRLLEIAAGTCRFGETPLANDPKITYLFSDLSEVMLRRAGPGTQRFAAHGSRLPLRQGMDTCLMLYDSLNYWLTEAEVLQLFREVRRVLIPQGIFIFDATTQRNSQVFFEGTALAEEREDCHITRESWYVKKEKRQYNRFTIFIQNAQGSYDKFQETHVQQIYPITTLKRLAQQAGFKVLAVLDDFTLKPAHLHSLRVHYVLEAKVLKVK